VVVLAIFGAAPASAQNVAPTCPANYEVTAPVGVNTPIIGQCSDEDGPAPLNYTVTDWPDHGSLGGSSDGNGVYRPFAPFIYPTDSFEYYASDGVDESPVSTVTITIEPPPAGNQAPFCPNSDAFVEDDSTVVLAGNCVDPEHDPITYGLTAPSPTKGSLSIVSASSVLYDPFPTTVGPTTDQFGYTARDDFHSPETVVVDIDILPAGATTFASAPEATDTEQYVAEVQSPNGGPVNIDRRPTNAVPPDDGFSMLGEEFDIDAPNATFANPLRLTFTFDQSVPTDNLTVFRDGAEVQPCTSPADATPDPCYEPIEEAGGDVSVTVRTSHASIWTFATKPEPPRAYDFRGFLLHEHPRLNTVKAGSTVPVIWRIAGREGPDVLAPGYPKSQGIACNSTGAVPGNESTQALSILDPLYVRPLGLYAYGWKTKRAWDNTCRQFVLKFNDPAASEARANFKFK
jgi:hypothetical protein